MTTVDELIRILEDDDDDDELQNDELQLHAQYGEETEFNWLAEEPPPPVIEEFDDFTSGISPSVISKASSVLDIIEHFVNHELIEHIVKSTNQYHQRLV